MLNKYRIVIRGHKTKNIQGVSKVTCIHSLMAYGYIKSIIGASSHTVDVVDTYTTQDVRAEKNITTNTIYIGGTGQMWATLKSRIRYYQQKNLDSIYRVNTGATRAFIYPTSGYFDFILYMKVFPSGREVLAVFGPGPFGTLWAAKSLSEEYQKWKANKYKEALHIRQAPDKDTTAFTIYKLFR